METAFGFYKENIFGYDDLFDEGQFWQHIKKHFIKYVHTYPLSVFTVSENDVKFLIEATRLFGFIGVLALICRENYENQKRCYKFLWNIFWAFFRWLIYIFVTFWRNKIILHKTDFENHQL